ncbi:hypothetical protein O1611_g1611 [Lasiodiplodia mahajangana]|uniref:Uncharacterized protein n=1 Tax=Lasiodiplodia mahajangana TaxID=1108764 RepID=A0ACC2JXJ0_9PEZI|nr:hypothetical protein O1611_g1611 [Lasiodiplodia mahajangana]
MQPKRETIAIGYHYTCSDVPWAENGTSIRNWATGIVRLCRAANRGSAAEQMAELYNMIYPGLKQLIVKPDDTPGFRLEDFLTHLEEKAVAHRGTLAQQNTPQTIKRNVVGTIPAIHSSIVLSAVALALYHQNPEIPVLKPIPVLSRLSSRVTLHLAERVTPGSLRVLNGPRSGALRTPRVSMMK